MKEKLHKVNSVTKRMFSILVGIEIDRGELGGISQSIEDFIPILKIGRKTTPYRIGKDCSIIHKNEF